MCKSVRDKTPTSIKLCLSKNRLHLKISLLWNRLKPVEVTNSKHTSTHNKQFSSEHRLDFHGRFQIKLTHLSNNCLQKAHKRAIQILLPEVNKVQRFHVGPSSQATCARQIHGDSRYLIGPVFIYIMI